MTGIQKRAYGWTVLRRARRAESRLRAEFPDAWRAVEKTRNAGGLTHAMQPLRLLELTELLRRFQPSTVLELGSGTTTAVFAGHVPSGSDGPGVTSLEESEHWQGVARSALPPGSENRVRLTLAPRVLETWDGQRVARYDIPYDRVIVVDSKRHSIFLQQGISRLYDREMPSMQMPPWKAFLKPYRHHSVFVRR